MALIHKTNNTTNISRNHLYQTDGLAEGCLSFKRITNSCNLSSFPLFKDGYYSLSVPSAMQWFPAG
jgi:hypothetical protein